MSTSPTAPDPTADQEQPAKRSKLQSITITAIFAIITTNSNRQPIIDAVTALLWAWPCTLLTNHYGITDPLTHLSAAVIAIIGMIWSLLKSTMNDDPHTRIWHPKPFFAATAPVTALQRQKRPSTPSSRLFCTLFPRSPPIPSKRFP